MAVYRDGSLQLDLRYGTASSASSRMLWFSVAKAFTAAAVLMLAERQILDLDRPIASYWPEFASGGKEQVTVRHVLLHQGGFPVFPLDFDWRDIDRWDQVTAATASVPALWEPGSAVGYHALTFGFALGEVIRRVDGRRPKDFIDQEICWPLGLAASIGLDDADHWRIVPLEAKSEATWQDPEGSERLTTRLVEQFELPVARRAQLPAANLFATAEAVARFFAMLERGGTLDGAVVLHADTVSAATSQPLSVTMDDVVTGGIGSYGLGFVVGGPFEPYWRPGVFGHSGRQCAVAWADTHEGFATAYCTTGLHDPDIVQARVEEIAEALYG